ncbi:MAG: flavodoxin family protein BilS [Eubacteriales bacterium]|jgi:flavodoxin
MRYMVLYSSITGNTRLLADALYRELPQPAEIRPMETVLEQNGNEVLFIGFWNDKGHCDKKTQKVLSGLHGRKVALFGTMGSSDVEQYGQLVLSNVLRELPEDNEVLGTFLCQGKLAPSARMQYLEMLKNSPDNPRLLEQLRNYELSQGHPDRKDLENLRCFTRGILARLATQSNPI